MMLVDRRLKTYKALRSLAFSVLSILLVIALVSAQVLFSANNTYGSPGNLAFGEESENLTTASPSNPTNQIHVDVPVAEADKEEEPAKNEQPDEETPEEITDEPQEQINEEVVAKDEEEDEIEEEEEILASEIVVPEKPSKSLRSSSIKSVSSLKDLESVTPLTVSTWTCGTSEVIFDDVTGALIIRKGELPNVSSSGDWVWDGVRSRVTSVTFEGAVTAGASVAYMFCNMPNLTKINNLSSLNTSKTNDFNSLFLGCKNLTLFDLSRFSTEEATNLSGMFYGCEQLASLDLSPFNTSKVENMLGMFYGCLNLTDLNISSFQTSKVENFSYMFALCKKLPVISVGNFDTSKATTMAQMFYQCESLATIDVSGFSTAQVTDFTAMFRKCSALKSLDVSAFDMAQARAFPYMFANCSALKILDLSSFVTPKQSTGLDISHLFDGCTLLQSVNLPNINTVTTPVNMSSLFLGCKLLREFSLGNTFCFTDESSYPPPPEGADSEGRLYTGSWYSAATECSYASNEIPNNIADTYVAQVSIGALELVGDSLEGATLEAITPNAGEASLVYKWTYSDTLDGSLTEIPEETSSSYALSTEDVGRYIQCTASYNAYSISDQSSTIEAGISSPVVETAVLQGDGEIIVTYMAKATIATPYTSLDFQYSLDSGEWLEGNSITGVWTEETSSTTIVDLSKVFKGTELPGSISIRARAHNFSATSDWSNAANASPDPQIKASMPTSMAAVIGADGVLLAPAQSILNTGTLNIRVTDISMTKLNAEHPNIYWKCSAEKDQEKELIWEGGSSSSESVESSPVVAPGDTVDLLWSATMATSNALAQSVDPIPFASIHYSIGFAGQ